MARAVAYAPGGTAWSIRLEELVERKALRSLDRLPSSSPPTASGCRIDELRRGLGTAQVQGTAVGPGVAGVQQSDLFEQYTKVLHAVARRRPLLLLLDDLQWADLGSISLLFHLGRRLAGSRILILGAYRPEEVALSRDGPSTPRQARDGAGSGQRERHPLDPVLSEFQRDFGEITVELGQTGDRELVDAFLDSEPNRLGAAFRETLYRRTGGHLLFIVELLRGMQERGDLVQDGAGCWVEAAERTGERWYEAELHRLRKELLLRCIEPVEMMQGTDEPEVEACFRRAIEVARRQRAKSWELRATMSLCRL